MGSISTPPFPYNPATIGLRETQTSAVRYPTHPHTLLNQERGHIQRNQEYTEKENRLGTQ